MARVHEIGGVVVATQYPSLRHVAARCARGREEECQRLIHARPSKMIARVRGHERAHHHLGAVGMPEPVNLVLHPLEQLRVSGSRQEQVGKSRCAGRRCLVLELVDPALRASKVLRQQHAARDADRYERPQVIIVDRAAGGEEVKEEERQAHPSRSRRSHFREFFDGHDASSHFPGSLQNRPRS